MVLTVNELIINNQRIDMTIDYTYARGKGIIQNDFFNIQLVSRDSRISACQ